MSGGVVSKEGAALEQSCASPKTVEINFLIRKEERAENELGVESKEGDALEQSYASTKNS